MSGLIFTNFGLLICFDFRLSFLCFGCVPIEIESIYGHIMSKFNVVIEFT